MTNNLETKIPIVRAEEIRNVFHHIKFGKMSTYEDLLTTLIKQSEFNGIMASIMLLTDRNQKRFEHQKSAAIEACHKECQPYYEKLKEAEGLLKQAKDTHKSAVISALHYVKNHTAEKFVILLLEQDGAG